MQSLLGRICGTSRPTQALAPQKSVRGGDNDDDEDDGKLSKARDNLNGGQSLQRQVLRPVGASLLAT